MRKVLPLVGIALAALVLLKAARPKILYALDRATGAQLSSFDIGTWVASGPAISGNALLAGAWDGNLYAFAGR